MKKVISVDRYIEKHSHFGNELTLLRTLMNSTDLEEHIKWNAPVYSIDGKNVIGLGAFKHHFGIWFFNGVFLKDKMYLLEQAQKTTKGLRQMRFKSMADIDKKTVLSYVKDAIQNQKLGKELKPERKGKKVSIPVEFKTALSGNSVLSDAFKLLTPAKQREYAEYINSAKREDTKHSRLKKYSL